VNFTPVFNMLIWRLQMFTFKFFHIAAVSSLMLLSAGLASQAHEATVGSIKIEHPWARQSPMKADVVAGFMTITNSGTVDDRLVKATAEITPVVQLHDMKIENDVMKMFEMKDGIPVPAGSTVELKPASLHVMFMGLKSPPVEGQMIKGTLTFEKAGVIDVMYQVSKPDAGMQ
jgi:periplasmic copper chaperone A